MKRHYINKKYVDPDGGAPNYRNVPGHRVKMKVDLRRGTVVKPTVSWHVEREASEDDRFVEDPQFDVRTTPTTSWGRDVDRHWLTLTIGKVLGARYTVSVKLDGQPAHSFAPFETWYRVFLNVNAGDAYLYGLFSKALSGVKKIFERACIAIEENEVTVAGTKTKEKDHSEQGDRGARITVTLSAADWYPFSHNVVVKIANRAVTEPKYATLTGDTLRLSIAEICRWKASPEHLTSITAKGGAGTLATVGRDDVAGVSARVDNRTLTVDLAAQALAPVQAEIAAGRAVEITLATGVEQFGREGGQGGAGYANIKLWRQAELTLFGKTQTSAQIAALVAHEVGHALGLVDRNASEAYRGTRNVYAFTEGGADERRAPATVSKAHPRKHGPEFGGSGHHCTFNTHRVDDTSTSSKKRVEVMDGMKSCVMFHSTLDRVRDEGFCDTCIAHLRRVAAAR